MLAVLIVLASPARAQVVIDRPAAIIIFPEVVAGAGRDTIIQITNVGNSLLYARCFYIDTSSSSTEFDIVLTKQQPTFWVVSQGRLLNNASPGLNNLVPAVTPPFRGELMCVIADRYGFPLAANWLIGEATVVDTSSGDVAKYHAVGLRGLDTANGDNVLCLGGGVTTECPHGAEYDACPQSWLLDHLSDGAPDSVIGAGSAVHTALSIAPCSHDLTSQTQQTVAVQFLIRNQFAQASSAATSINGPTDIALASIAAFSRNQVGTDYAQTRISSVPGQGNGIVALAQEFHTAASLTSSATVNLHAQGARTDRDQVVLPLSGAFPPGTAVFHASGDLRGIASGPDGNVWFTELVFDPGFQTLQGQIGRVTPNGVIEEFDALPPGAQPGAITTGPDGNVWFTDYPSQVGRISPDGLVVVEFPIASAANSITGGPDGNVWFTEPEANSIGRITPDGATLKEFPLATQDHQLTSITLGPDGNLWFTEGGFPGKVGRITPDGSSIVEFDLSGAVGPTSITLGPDGNLWFVEATASQVGRITPAGDVSEFAVPGSPTTINRVADGNLWFTGGGFNSCVVLGRITPAGAVTAFLNLCGTAITGGADGNVWLMGPQPGRRTDIIRFSP